MVRVMGEYNGINAMGGRLDKVTSYRTDHCSLVSRVHSVRDVVVVSLATGPLHFSDQALHF